jgi:BASS family bile acid:Na+ symporter
LAYVLKIITAIFKGPCVLMPAFLDITIPLFNFLIMFTVGTGLTLTDFRCVAREPRTLILASLAQIVCLPLVGLMVVNLLVLNPFVVAGVLLIAACPGGSISNFYIYLARANVALSVVLTGISCLVAVVTMPLVMTGFEHFMSVPEAFHVPVVNLLLTLVLFLLVPILLGMLLRHFGQAFVARNDRWFRRGSMVLLTALVIQVIGQAPRTFLLDFSEIIKASSAMAGLAILAGFLVGRAMKLEALDFWTVVVELMVQNIALAAMIAVTVFHQPRFASFAAAYFLVQVPFAAALILACTRTHTARRTGSIQT